MTSSLLRGWRLARFALALAAASPAALPAQEAGRGRDLAAVVDSIVGAALRDGEGAGASVAVVRGRDTLVLRSYGLADVELGAPMPARAVYQIGSVTKQFTAVALLQLAERGKLSLDDPITRFLPRYPMQGARVTIRQLLTHTSGIREHTDLPEFWRIAPLALPRDSLVALFSAKPFDFTPGTAMRYDNSGYFLAGLIIEQASGMPYEEYLRRHLFAPSGMPDSHYCSNTAVVKNRAKGYRRGERGLERAAYIDLAWPYAGGSICSTAGDLVAWNRALHGGALLSPSSYRALVTPGTLADGTRLRYALGLRTDSLSGRRALSHTGGIPGFSANMDYFPEDSLTILVLTNSEGAPRPQQLTGAIRDAVYGPWAPHPVPPRDVAQYAGEYRGSGHRRGWVVRVAADAAGGLTGQGLDGALAPPTPLLPLGGDTFGGTGPIRYIFQRQGARITGVRIDLVRENVLLARK